MNYIEYNTTLRHHISSISIITISSRHVITSIPSMPMAILWSIRMPPQIISTMATGHNNNGIITLDYQLGWIMKHILSSMPSFHQNLIPIHCKGGWEEHHYHLVINKNINANKVSSIHHWLITIRLYVEHGSLLLNTTRSSIHIIKSLGYQNVNVTIIISSRHHYQ